MVLLLSARNAVYFEMPQETTVEGETVLPVQISLQEGPTQEVIALDEVKLQSELEETRMKGFLVKAWDKITSLLLTLLDSL